MEPISTTKAALSLYGLLKDLFRLTTKPVRAIYRKFKPDNIHDCGYIILYRKISAHYTTVTSGLLTHEIEIKATKDHVSHYYGRYLHRGGKAKTNLTVKSAHRGLSLDKIETGFQKFTVQLRNALAKNQREIIVMAVEWEDDIQGQNPEVAMHILCPTHSLEFTVVLPNGTGVKNADGQISHHPGLFMPVKTEKLTANGGVLFWKPTILKPRLTYLVSWEWA